MMTRRKQFDPCRSRFFRCSEKTQHLQKPARCGCTGCPSQLMQSQCCPSRHRSQWQHQNGQLRSSTDRHRHSVHHCKVIKWPPRCCGRAYRPADALHEMQSAGVADPLRLPNQW
eukprot:2888240-Karenia_brevis.AAC.1